MKTFALGILVAAAVAFAIHAQAQQSPSPLPYAEGTVWEISTVKVKSGFSEDYLRSMGATWKKVMEEAKKQKLILSYKVLSSDASSREDWNIMLMIEYANMAALDGLEPKMRALALPTVGGEEGRKEFMTKRLEVREIVGSKLARELILK